MVKYQRLCEELCDPSQYPVALDYRDLRHLVRKLSCWRKSKKYVLAHVESPDSQPLVSMEYRVMTGNKSHL